MIIISNLFFFFLIGEYSVNYVVVGVKIYLGSLIIKFVIDGGEDMFVGFFELNWWSGVMRFVLMEKKIWQYVFKQEWIEWEGFVFFDIMYLEDGEDDENEIFFFRGKEVVSIGDDDDDDDEVVFIYKCKVFFVDVVFKYCKVLLQLSFFVEVCIFYFVCWIKNIFFNVVEYKVQVGVVQFLYDEGWGDGV